MMEELPGRPSVFFRIPPFLSALCFSALSEGSFRRARAGFSPFPFPALPLFPRAFSPRGDVPSDMTESPLPPAAAPGGPLCFLCVLRSPAVRQISTRKLPHASSASPVGSGPSLRFPLSRLGKARFAGEMSFSPIKNIDKSANTMESCLVPKGVPRHSEDGGPDGRVLLTARLFCA